MGTVDTELKDLVATKVQEGDDLLQQVHSHFASVDGSQKLERRIRSEIKFLLKLLESKTEVKKEHILSSNLSSLAAVINILKKTDNPVSVFKPFSLQEGPIQRIEVDVVSDGGAVWHKAIARKAEALDDISKGRSSCGQKSVIDQAVAYLRCSQLHPYLFTPPKVVFHFFNSISSAIATRLNKMGVNIEGEIRPIQSSFSDGDSDDDEESDEDDPYVPCRTQNITTAVASNLQSGQLFLDITCMVAYVSSMTNGGANYVFPKTIYNQQAQWERVSAAKPKLDDLFQSNQLVTCQQALDDFQTLVNRMGGPGEKERTGELVKRLRIVADSNDGRLAKLQLTSNIKPRSRLIFCTADHLGIVIVTANTGFVRSAASQGIEIAHHVHEPRVLTEQQESFSRPLLA